MLIQYSMFVVSSLKRTFMKLLSDRIWWYHSIFIITFNLSIKVFPNCTYQIGSLSLFLLKARAYENHKFLDNALTYYVVGLLMQYAVETMYIQSDAFSTFTVSLLCTKTILKQTCSKKKIIASHKVHLSDGKFINRQQRKAKRRRRKIIIFIWHR
jgi:hypothetical protein